MDKGYIVVKQGREILHAVFSEEADFGSDFFNVARELFLTADVALFKREVIKRLDKLDGVRCDGATKKFYARTHENRIPEYPQITYEYDVKRLRMTLYLEGRKALVFDRDRVDYFDFLAKNYWSICHAFGKRHKDLTIDEKKAWSAYSVRVKYRKPLADIEREMRQKISENTVIVGKDEFNWFNFGIEEFEKKIHFYDKNGKREYTATLSVYFDHNNAEEGGTPTYNASLSNKYKSYIIERAPTIRSLQGRITRKIKDKNFARELKRFCQLASAENEVEKELDLQRRTPSRKQKQQLDSFTEALSGRIKALYAVFKNDDFSCISKDFCLAERQAEIVSHVLEYRRATA